MEGERTVKEVNGGAQKAARSQNYMDNWEGKGTLSNVGICVYLGLRKTGEARWREKLLEEVTTQENQRY